MDQLIDLDKIRQLRKNKKLTQLELAEIIGYTGRNTYNQIENGKRGMPLSKLKKLAEVFEVSIEELLK